MLHPLRSSKTARGCVSWSPCETKLPTSIRTLTPERFCISLRAGTWSPLCDPCSGTELHTMAFGGHFLGRARATRRARHLHATGAASHRRCCPPAPGKPRTDAVVCSSVVWENSHHKKPTQENIGNPWRFRRYQHLRNAHVARMLHIRPCAKCVGP